MTEKKHAELLNARLPNSKYYNGKETIKWRNRKFSLEKKSKRWWDLPWFEVLVRKFRVNNWSKCIWASYSWVTTGLYLLLLFFASRSNQSDWRNSIRLKKSVPKIWLLHVDWLILKAKAKSKRQKQNWPLEKEVCQRLDCLLVCKWMESLGENFSDHMLSNNKRKQIHIFLVQKVWFFRPQKYSLPSLRDISRTSFII